MFHLDIAGGPGGPQFISADQLMEAVRADKGSVRITGAVIDGPIDLVAVSFNHELILHDCTFRGHFDASDARFGKSLDLSRCTFEQNLSFAGARIDGSLYLTGTVIHRGGPSHSAHPARTTPDTASFSLIAVKGNLNADGLVSQAKVNIGGARIGGDASFTGAQITGFLNLEVAILEGSLNCGLVRIQATPAEMQLGPDPGDGSALMGGIKVAGQANFRGAVLDRDLVLYSADIHCGLRCGRDVNQRTEIGGDALLSAAQVSFGAEFSEARIGGNLNFQDAEVDGDLICQRTEIVPNQQAEEGLPAGTAHLPGVHVSGVVDFRGATIANDLYLQSATIKGGLFCRAFEVPPTPEATEGTRTTIGKNAWLAASSVAGGIDFSGVSIGGDLSLDGASVEGGLFCRPWRLRVLPLDALPGSSGSTVFVPTHIAGSALMAAAKVSGVVDFSGARIDHNLNLESAEIRNGLFGKPMNDHHTVIGGKALFTATKVSGVVDLTGAEIKEDLNLESADIKNGLVCRSQGDRIASVGGKMNLAGSYVAGGVNIGGLKIKGDLNADGAVIEGELDCFSTEGQRTELGGDALLVGSKVSGGVNLNRVALQNLNTQGATIEGKLTCKHAVVGDKALLSEMRVSGQVDFGGATVVDDLNLQGAVVEGRLSCRQTRVGGTVDLRACRVRNAELDFAMPEEVPGKPQRAWPTARIDGFEFQELVLGDRERGTAGGGYLELLASSPTFDVGTYYLIERWLRNRGEDEKADDVYLAMRRERRKNTAMHPLARALDRFFDYPIYLAMRFQWLFFVFLFFLLVTTLLFAADGAARLKDPEVQEKWSIMDAFWMSLQANVPMIHIPVADKWELTSHPITFCGFNCWMRYDHWASFVSILGYIVGPLFVAGVANTWLRQKGGGKS